MLLTLLTSLILGLQNLHEQGFRGEGITIAVIDCGFYRANNPDYIRQDKILHVYDLLKQDSINRPDIFSDPNNTHGANCLSIIAADLPNFTGTAPDANFIIIRTEDLPYEYYGEVERVAKGMLIADSLGADILTISLGYATFDGGINDFTYADMTGKANIASRTATELARRGKLVCIAAGNYGDGAWHYITCPSDADSILTVGACRIDSIHASFSGYGPTADGRIKPDVSAWGEDTHYLNLNTGEVRTGRGTSYACPEIAGMAACLWQALPDKTAMQIRDLIILSAHQYNNPDNLLGYGIPDAYRAYLMGKDDSTDYHESTQPASGNTQKILRHGQLYIVRDGIWYTLLGTKLQ